MKNRQNSLSGYRVIDLTDEKGMLCPRLLADMGADVVRVEVPGTPSTFDHLNAGKRNITLNLKTGRGRQIFRKLIKTADVLVESFPPGFLAKINLDYTRLSRLNPRLIMASITDFGQTGPHRDYKSYDIVSSALGGQMYVCGEPDSPPIKPYGKQAYSACLFAANGILLALWQLHTSGKGQYIDISMHECVAATLDHVLVRYFYVDEIAKREGNLHWNDGFRIFSCKDGYILLSLFLHWETLVEWLASEGMAEDLTDKKWLAAEFRHEHVNHIIEILEKWTKSHNVDELVETGQLMRFPWARVTSIPELLASPQLKERRFFIEARHPESGKKYKLPGTPCKLSRSPWQVSGKISAIGEHNYEIYGELGLSGKELKALAEEGII